MKDEQPMKLQAGQKVRDTRDNRQGVVLDLACQYAHPKAAPVYSYLIQWHDGIVQAVSEGAFRAGLETVD